MAPEHSSQYASSSIAPEIWNGRPATGRCTSDMEVELVNGRLVFMLSQQPGALPLVRAHAEPRGAVDEVLAGSYGHRAEPSKASPSMEKSNRLQICIGDCASRDRNIRGPVEQQA